MFPHAVHGHADAGACTCLALGTHCSVGVASWTRRALLVPLLVAVSVGIGALSDGGTAAASSRATVASAGTEPATATAAARKRCGRRSRPPCAHVRARRLAGKVMRAQTAPARYRALLTVMRALRVRVYSSSGKVLSRGGRDLPRSFHLYDLELQAMAQSMLRGDSRTLEEVAAMLAAMGVKNRGNAVRPKVLRRVLTAGVRSAARRRGNFKSMVPLLARELGRRHSQPIDLKRNVAANRVKLDALQTFLVLADVGLGLRRRTRKPAKASVSVPATAAAGPCTGDAATVATEVSGFGKWVVGTGAAALTGFNPIVVGGLVTLDTIHGVMLESGVRVSALSPQLVMGTVRGHYGPSGHDADAGTPMEFKIRVEMLDELPEHVIKCGPLIGMKFPKKGGIPGVTILWREGDLAEHGTVAYRPTDKKTDVDGIATLVFTPKDETGLGIGTTMVERGVVSGTAAYQSAFNSGVGSLQQFISPNYVAGLPWEVSFHDQDLVLDVGATTIQNLSYEPSTAVVRVAGLPLDRMGPDTAAGESALDLLGYEVADAGCWSHTWSAAPAAPFRVTSLRIDRSVPGAPTVGSMTIDAGTLNESVTHTCYEDSISDSRDSYREVMQQAIPGGLIEGWEANPGGDVFARKTITYNANDSRAQVNLVLRLVPAR
jgi:hypothetical protein